MKLSGWDTLDGILDLDHEHVLLDYYFTYHYLLNGFY